MGSNHHHRSESVQSLGTEVASTAQQGSEARDALGWVGRQLWGDTMRERQVQGAVDSANRALYHMNADSDPRIREAANLEMRRQGLPIVHIDEHGVATASAADFDQNTYDRSQTENVVLQFTGSNSWKLDQLSQQVNDAANGNVSREDIAAVLQQGTIHDATIGADRALTPAEQQGLRFMSDKMYRIGDEYGWSNGYGLSPFNDHLGASNDEILRYASSQGVTPDSAAATNTIFNRAERQITEEPLSDGRPRTKYLEGAGAGGEGEPKYYPSEKTGGAGAGKAGESKCPAIEKSESAEVEKYGWLDDIFAKNPKPVRMGTRQFQPDGNGNMSYEISHGDSIWRVAADVASHRLGHHANAREIANTMRGIARANGYDKPGRDPNLIQPGSRLIIPGEED